MTYSVYLSSYTIGESSYDHIASVCQAYGKKVALIIGDYGYDQAKSALDEAITKSGLSVATKNHFGGACTYKNVEKLTQILQPLEVDMIFAIGGGRVLDTGKLVGEVIGKPVFSFPTIASNCAACTSVSIMYDDEGAFLKPHFLKEPPKHAFIQTSVLVKAPVKYLWAGLGDTYAKYYEASFSARDESLSQALTMGINISRQCAEGILSHGVGALEANRKQKLTDDFEQAISIVIVTTALVSILVTLDHTPDYNSGLAHAIYYTLTSMPDFDEQSHLHGEIVAFGVLILLLVDGQEENFQRVYDFNRATKLPHSLQALDLTQEKMAPYINAITKMKDIEHSPYPITAEMLHKAFEALEKINHSND